MHCDLDRTTQQQVIIMVCLWYTYLWAKQCMLYSQKKLLKCTALAKNGSTHTQTRTHTHTHSHTHVGQAPRRERREVWARCVFCCDKICIVIVRTRQTIELKLVVRCCILCARDKYKLSLNWCAHNFCMSAPCVHCVCVCLRLYACMCSFSVHVWRALRLQIGLKLRGKVNFWTGNFFALHHARHMPSTFTPYMYTVRTLNTHTTHTQGVQLPLIPPFMLMRIAETR